MTHTKKLNVLIIEDRALISDLLSLCGATIRMRFHDNQDETVRRVCVGGRA
jgi:hypothetical protein